MTSYCYTWDFNPGNLTIEIKFTVIAIPPLLEIGKKQNKQKNPVMSVKHLCFPMIKTKLFFFNLAP